jgi:hypothetical protein
MPAPADGRELYIQGYESGFPFVCVGAYELSTAVIVLCWQAEGSVGTVGLDSPSWWGW